MMLSKTLSIKEEPREDKRQSSFAKATEDEERQKTKVRSKSEI